MGRADPMHRSRPRVVIPSSGSGGKGRDLSDGRVDSPIDGDGVGDDHEVQIIARGHALKAVTGEPANHGAPVQDSSVSEDPQSVGERLRAQWSDGKISEPGACQGRGGADRTGPAVCGVGVDLVGAAGLEQLHRRDERLARVQQVVHQDARPAAAARESTNASAPRHQHHSGPAANADTGPIRQHTIRAIISAW
jgi:hypothetical protein